MLDFVPLLVLDLHGARAAVPLRHYPGLPARARVGRDRWGKHAGSILVANTAKPQTQLQSCIESESSVSSRSIQDFPVLPGSTFSIPSPVDFHLILQ